MSLCMQLHFSRERGKHHCDGLSITILVLILILFAGEWPCVLRDRSQRQRRPRLHLLRGQVQHHQQPHSSTQTLNRNTCNSNRDYAMKSKWQILKTLLKHDLHGLPWLSCAVTQNYNDAYSSIAKVYEGVPVLHYLENVHIINGFCMNHRISWLLQIAQ